MCPSFCCSLCSHSSSIQGTIALPPSQPTPTSAHIWSTSKTQCSVMQEVQQLGAQERGRKKLSSMLQTFQSGNGKRAKAGCGRVNFFVLGLLHLSMNLSSGFLHCSCLYLGTFPTSVPPLKLYSFQLQKGDDCSL